MSSQRKATAAMYRLGLGDSGREPTSLVGVHRPKLSEPAGGLGHHSHGPCFDKVTSAEARRLVDLGSETSRSSSPATDASSSQTPSSVSSWGTTSGSQEGEPGECGYPGDDEDISSGSRSRRASEEAPESLRVLGLLKSPRIPENMVGRADPRTPSSRGDHDANDSDSNEDESSSCMADEDEDDEEDSDWSGEDDSLDAAIIAAVDGDLALAAFLIPLLHQSLNSGVRRKVESWQCGSPTGSGDRSSDIQRPPSSSTSANRSPTSPRKRRRRTSSGDGERIGDGEGGDDDEDGSGNGKSSSQPEAADSVAPRLACPFHKYNPSKYGIQHGAASGNQKNDFYRACAGPGSRNIQRLKEHLKRKHNSIQCERCYTVFRGKDATEQLSAHLRNDEPCQKGNPELREGISSVQWRQLDKQNRKKPQEAHKLDKWFEIWDVLFPGKTRPSTPWYDSLPSSTSPSTTQEGEEFANIFYNILSHKVRQGDINLQDEQNTMERLKSVVQQTFKTWVSLKGSQLQSDASSSLTASNIQSSLVGGSSTHLSGRSGPSNSASHQLTTSSTSMTSANPAGASNGSLPPSSRPQYHPLMPQTAAAGGPTGGAQYIGAIAMARQTSQFAGQMPATMPIPAAQATAVPMPNFSQEDMSNMSGMNGMNGINSYFFCVQQPPVWPPGLQYPGVAAHAFGGNHQLNQEYFSNSGADSTGFGAANSASGDFSGLH